MIYFNCASILPMHLFFTRNILSRPSNLFDVKFPQNDTDAMECIL